jgi:hypothetical protein
MLMLILVKADNDNGLLSSKHFRATPTSIHSKINATYARFLSAPVKPRAGTAGTHPSA